MQFGSGRWWASCLSAAPRQLAGRLQITLASIMRNTARRREKRGRATFWLWTLKKVTRKKKCSTALCTAMCIRVSGHLACTGCTQLHNMTHTHNYRANLLTGCWPSGSGLCELVCGSIPFEKQQSFFFK